MLGHERLIKTFQQQGFAKAYKIFQSKEIKKIIQLIETYSLSTQDTKSVFAIRQLINKIPMLSNLLFKRELELLLENYFTDDYFLTKAIFFDKPAYSNWFVAYHQDLSISVEGKTDVQGYAKWTYKQQQYGVQPPLSILQNTLTLRIHLDDTNHYNGALRVIPNTHRMGVMKASDIDKTNEKVCSMKRGDVMLMSPLLMHASNKTTNNKRRRVIHLEFCDKNLASPLKWLEKKDLKKQGYC